MTRIDIKLLHQQIEDLQTQITYQEDMTQSLHNIVTTQDRTISILEEKIAYLGTKLKEIDSNLSTNRGAIDNNKPPHY